MKNVLFPLVFDEFNFESFDYYYSSKFWESLLTSQIIPYKHRIGVAYKTYETIALYKQVLCFYIELMVSKWVLNAPIIALFSEVIFARFYSSIL